MRESAVPRIDRRERLFCVHELILGGRFAFCHLTRQAVPASRNAGALCPPDVCRSCSCHSMEHWHVSDGAAGRISVGWVARRSNQSLQPTADRRENFQIMTSVVEFAAQLGSLSGG